jgi:hypothetical protein
MMTNTVRVARARDMALNYVELFLKAQGGTPFSVVPA